MNIKNMHRHRLILLALLLAGLLGGLISGMARRIALAGYGSQGSYTERLSQSSRTIKHPESAQDSSSYTVSRGRAASTAHAQSGGNYVILKSVIAGGGGASGSGNYAVAGTLGQSATGASGGDSFSISGGFMGGEFVICPAISINPAALPDGWIGLPYNQQMTQTGGAGSITWSVSANALPIGLILNSATGVITGMPIVIGTFNFVIRATDINNCFGERAYSITVNTYEADVAPRPNGSGTVVVSDWVQVGRFSVGLDTPAMGSEFQRADCAPRSTLGDGKITVADWVQAGRYSVGLDPLTLVGGPTSPAALQFGDQLKMATQTQGRVMRAVNANFTRGRIGAMQVEFDALGNENALAFTVSYDPRMAVFLDAVSEERTGEATLVVNGNDASKGRVAVAMAMPTGKVFTAGTNGLLTLRFIPTGGEGRSEMEVTFDDSLVERELTNPDAVLLPQPQYVSSRILIEGESATIVSAASYEPVTLAPESIATVFGQDLAAWTESAMTDPLPMMLGGSRVTVRDSKGLERQASLFYVSPTQINFLIPNGCALGPATVTIRGASGAVSMGLINIVDVAPGLFTTEDGLAAATLIRGDDENDYLALYGTGWRNLSDPNKMRVLINRIEARVLYAGAQGTFAGLDQINVLLPRDIDKGNPLLVDLIINGKRIPVARFN